MGAALLLAACGTFWMPAAAQGKSATYRCGNTYTDRPCEGGKQFALDDMRTEADRRAAEAATRRAEQRADQLERIRLSQEKEAYERSRRSAHDARQAAMAERRLAASEQLARARAQNSAPNPASRARASAVRPTTGPPQRKAEAAGKSATVQAPAEGAGGSAAAAFALAAASRSNFCQSVSRLSTWAGLIGMHATGHTCTHCGSSKWPTHSVHLCGSIS